MENPELGNIKNILETFQMEEMDEDTFKYITAQIIKGLQYLHDKNISYIDLRPENIFITNDGVIKIGNYGFSNLQDYINDHRTNIKSI